MRLLIAAASLAAAIAAPAFAQSSAVTAPLPNPALVEELVTANHILYDQGIVDGFGHISVRDDENPDHFLMSRSMAPGLVTAADIMVFDRDANPLDAKGRAVYLERFIHSEIYKARPDVKAVVHSHSPSVIPFGATETPLKPIYHMSSFLGTGAPIFEIRDAGGPATDMLIRNPQLGAALAKTLGDHTVALMRGHGDVVVGDSIRQVVFRAVYTETNAKLEAQALELGHGKVNFLNAEEAAASAKVNAGLVSRAYELWKRKALAEAGH